MDLTFLRENIFTLLAVAKTLSAVLLVVILVALVNVWRRKSFPLASYGDIFLTERRMRWGIVRN